jgi:hypothetical protein
MSAGNYPNPFNPSTVIEYGIPARGTAAAFTLTVYNAGGARVRTLLKGTAGISGARGKIAWDGRDNRGVQVCAGIYYYMLSAGNRTVKGSMVLVK